jgi:hypothetical protein
MNEQERRRLAAGQVFRRNVEEVQNRSVFLWDEVFQSDRPLLAPIHLEPGELPILTCSQGEDGVVVLTTTKTTFVGRWSVDHADVVAIKPAVMVFGEEDDPPREALVVIDREHRNFRFLAGTDTLVGVWNALLYCVRSVKGL